MTTEEYLDQIRHYDWQITNKLEEISELRERLKGASSVSNGERVQTSGDKDRVGSCVSKIVDMEREVDSLIDKRLVIVRQIESVRDPQMYNVLAKRWILGKDFKVIGIEIGKCRRQTSNIRDNALAEFERMYGELYL